MIQCDNAPEFVGGKFRDYCNARGITLQYTEAYEHPHNRTATWFKQIVARKITCVNLQIKIAYKILELHLLRCGLHVESITIFNNRIKNSI